MQRNRYTPAELDRHALRDVGTDIRVSVRLALEQTDEVERERWLTYARQRTDFARKYARGGAHQAILRGE